VSGALSTPFGKVFATYLLVRPKASSSFSHSDGLEGVTMNQISGCPDVSAYRELMRGRSLPDRETLLGHLETCPQCQRTVQALEDWMTNVPTSGASDNEARRRARQIVGRAPSSAPTGGGDGDESLAVLPTGLLSPPQVPGELGRLGGYRVLRVLGKGGMGLVFEAEDVSLRRRVALKVMRPEVAAFAAHRERFLREARAVASVASDHVCPIFQVGEDNGVPFIAMPLLKGEPLDARLERGKPLPVADVVRIGREIALGLAAAHEADVVHRDVKPANVWLEVMPKGPPRARLLDFGLARGGTDEHLTRTGEVMGTPSYLSPEQARGQKVDGRSDLFSLGVVLYEMAAGKRPFKGSDPVSVLSSLALDTPAAPASLRPEVPEALSALIMHLLEKAPQDRPAGAAEVAERLGQMQAFSTPTPVPAAEETSTNYVLLMGETPRPGPPATGRPAPAHRGWGRLAWAAVLGLAVALGVGVAAYTLFFQTAEGTLVVEVEGDAEVRFAQGELRLYGDDGKLKYTLKPSEKNKSLPPGSYRVKVEGADGLKLDTERFELEKRGKVVVRVTAAPPVAKEVEKEKAYQAAMKDARAARDAGRWADALAHYADALRHKPDDPAALAGRRAAQDELDGAKQQAKKEAAYREAMKKAEAAMKAKKYDEAIKAYAEALRHRPKDQSALAGAEQADKLRTDHREAAKKEAEVEKLFRQAMDAQLGLSGQMDLPRSLRLFRQAADGGHVVAACWVGYCTSLGRGTKKDEAEGRRLVEQALPEIRRKAAGGDADAQSLFGALLAVGLGVDRDDRKAAEWSASAAGKGDAFAMNRLGWAYEIGRGVDRDESKAAEWYQKAADKGHALAMGSLGRAYLTGRGVEKDEKKAEEWATRAADRGHVNPLTQLASAYFGGWGVKQDEKKAARLYRLAADRGDASATFQLGWMHENGRGVDRDATEALAWYRKAAALGHDEAKRKVKEVDAYQEAMKDARAAADARKWADAARYYGEALRHKPDDPAALKGRRAAQDELARDVQQAEEAKKKEAAYQAAMKKAEAAMKAEKYAEAQEAYAEALRHRPKDPDAIEGDERAARLLAEQQAYRSAMRDARAARAARKWAEALEHYDRALIQKPGDAEAKAGRKVAQDELDRADQEAKKQEVEKLYREALDVELGLTKEIDHARSLKLFRQAAEKGHSVSSGRVGWMIWFGRGTEKDQAEGAKKAEAALPSIREKAEQGDAEAQAILGMLLRDGVGVERDVKAAAKWLHAAAEKGHVDATCDLAITYLHGRGVDRDEKKAAELFRKAADKGNASALHELGSMYASGRGVDKDEKEAAELFQKAADKGHPPAMNSLGLACTFGRGVDKDEKKGVEWYQKAADRGHGLAMNNLGLAYWNGRGIDRDDKKAVEWFEKAADKGFVPAMANLALASDLGRGVPKDEKKAAEWYQKAADRGHLEMMVVLGLRYARGQGVEKDEKKAVEWYQKAADGGHGPGIYWLAFAYANGRGVDRDEKKAAELYEKAADKGISMAMYNLASMYELGRGVDKDDKKAREWYEKAADKGLVSAMNSLGLAYWNGRGIDRDDRKAVQWFQKAADKGFVPAMANLGLAYELGRGVPKDEEKALEWYKKAAAVGHQGAKRKVEEIESRTGSEAKSGERVVRLSKKGEVSGSDKQGKLLWRHDLHAEADRPGQVAISGERVVVAHGGLLAVLELSSGKVLWLRRGVDAKARMSVANDRVTLTAGDSRKVFDLRTGKEL
jgi:TPR repeat protein/tRNA A-37 threonylcarbamoyl transferase component Bud32